MSIPVDAGLLALACSLLPILWLALRDPKRLRVSGGDRQAALSMRARQVLALLSVLPGVVLVLLRDWPGLLVWAGALPALGWVTVLALSARASSTRLPN